MSNGSRMIERSKVMVPKDRVITRSKGCWNCIHWARDGIGQKQQTVVDVWQQKRQQDLATALNLALNAPDGEDNTRVKNIRAMVNSLDMLVASGHVGMCQGGGKTEDGNPVGDFVTHSFLCGNAWSGRTGASMAKDPTTNDTLPRELNDKLTPSG